MQAENDCVLSQTDITFNLAIEILNCLQKDKQLEVRSYQVVTIENIESDDSQDQFRFRFGGAHATSPQKSLQSFARTASSVLRMMMGRSVNASFSPRLGSNSDRRNRAKMVYEWSGEPFVLAHDKMTMMEYYSSYDHLHPHFRIEHQFTSVQPTEWWYMPLTMMLIFRQNFTEAIEISTTLQAGQRPWYGAGTFQSFANVRCIVRRISNPEHSSLKLLKALKHDPSKILSQYRQVLTPILDPQMQFPWTHAETDDSEEEDSEEEDSEEQDEDESEPEYVQTGVDLSTFPVRAITPESAPLSMFAGNFMPTPTALVIQRLGDHFASFNISDGRPQVQGRQ